MGPEEYYGYQQQQAGGFSNNDGDQTRRIIIVVGGLFLLIILFLVARALFFTTPNRNPEIARIASSHNEIIRVTNLGLDSDRLSRETRVAAANLKAVAITNFTEVTTYAATSPDFLPLAGVSLTARTNEEYDTRLEDAALVNNYEEVFEEILREVITQANTDMTNGYGEFSDLPTLQGLIDTASGRYAELADSF